MNFILHIKFSDKGHLYTVGDNKYGQLGRPKKYSNFDLVTVPSDCSEIKDAICGDKFTTAVTKGIYI